LRWFLTVIGNDFDVEMINLNPYYVLQCLKLKYKNAPWTAWGAIFTRLYQRNFEFPRHHKHVNLPRIYQIFLSQLENVSLTGGFSKIGGIKRNLIANLKHHYKSYILKQVIRAIDNDQSTQINVSWNEVKQTTITNWLSTPPWRWRCAVGRIGWQASQNRPWLLLGKCCVNTVVIFHNHMYTLIIEF